MRSFLGRAPGVISYTVDLREDSATVVYDPQIVTAAGVAQVLQRNGYPVREVVAVPAP